MGEIENLESARMIIKDPSLKGAVEQVITYGRVPTERKPSYQKSLIRDAYDTFKGTFKQVFNLKEKGKYLNSLENELGKKAQEVDSKIEIVGKREKELEEKSNALKAYEQELNQEKEKLDNERTKYRELEKKLEIAEKKYTSKYTSLQKYGIDTVGFKPGPKKKTETKKIMKKHKK